MRAKYPPEYIVKHAGKLVENADSEAVKLAALQLIAERAYGKVTEKHEVTAGARADEDDDEDLSLYTVEQLEQLAAAAHEFERRRGEIRDAVLVESEPLALPQASVALDGVSTTNR